MCFTCENQKSNWYCLKPTICSDTDSYCVTTSTSAGLRECGCGVARLPQLPPPSSTHSLLSRGAAGVVDLGYSLSKFCSPICGSTNLNFGVASMDRSCCQSFLCNISAADGVPRASTPVLGLGLLLSLLAALLWARP